MDMGKWQKSLICADSKDIIRRIPDNSIDFILTDPPYNLGQFSTGNIPLPGRSAMNNDVAEWDKIDFNPEEWADEFCRIIKPNGNIFIFTSYNQLGRWYNCFDKKFDTTNFMIWHKTNPAPKIFKAGFLNSCEMIFTCWNKKHTWNFISQKEMHNFIETSICMRPERLANPKHPAQKPIKVLEKLIRIASNENDIIFDPFMGVGSVGVAAIKLKRKFIGVEIDKIYCNAAIERVNKELEMRDNKPEYELNSETDIVKEPDCLYGQKVSASLNTVAQKVKPDWIIDIERPREASKQTAGAALAEDRYKIERLRPLLKWPGGKEKELKYILPLLPNFENYYEPFVGGGSVFATIKAKRYFVNDKSEDLIGLYNSIAESNEQFFFWIEDISSAWNNMLCFAQDKDTIKRAYKSYRADEMSEAGLLSFLQSYLDELKKSNKFSSFISESFHWHNKKIEEIFVKNIKDKMHRMKNIELKRGFLSEEDVQKNIETAYMSTLYIYFRMLYNDTNVASENTPLHISLFLFLRCYAYSGMFRYNDKGEFNVPYGGMSYNKKSLQKEMDYYKSEELLRLFHKATISCLDFEKFFCEFRPQKNDFIFLDPPYDSDFSTYDKNSFTRADHKRLANYLINKCNAKWLLDIKATPFILSLYENKGLSITSFDKKYQVSFMNRNNKAVEHLIIKNY